MDGSVKSHGSSLTTLIHEHVLLMPGGLSLPINVTIMCVINRLHYTENK